MANQQREADTVEAVRAQSEGERHKVSPAADPDATVARSTSRHMRVFINYRREDASGHAAHLYETLAQELGHRRVFMDVETMDPGVDFVDAIDRAVSNCDVLIALIGRYWLTAPDGKARRRIDDPNDYVRLEIEAALQHRVRVIPVLVDGAKMPEPEELPGRLVGLSRRQALEITPGRWAFDVGRLLTVLKRLEGETGPADTAAPPEEPPESVSKPERAASTLASAPSASGPAVEGPPEPSSSASGSGRARPKKRRMALAGGGAVLALVMVGLVGLGSGDEAYPNQAEQELLDHVPDFIKSGDKCQRPDQSVYKGAVGITCDPNTTIRVSYYKFKSTQDMINTYDDLIAGHDLTPASCNPSNNADFSGYGTWGDPVVGRYACYLSDGHTPWIEWTHDGLGIYAYAFAVGDDQQALSQGLYDFWIEAGPFRS